MRIRNWITWLLLLLAMIAAAIAQDRWQHAETYRRALQSKMSSEGGKDQQERVQHGK